MPPAICPHCGAGVPPKAKACPACGADEQTGWSAAAREATPDLPDDDFDYDDFVRREFEGATAGPRGIHWFWWLVAVALIAGWLVFLLR
jgi:hypothetical protein